jgi:hypothetical protein
MSFSPIKRAFQLTREGRSPEFIICDESLNSKFRSEARRLGFAGTEAQINTQLMSLRKQGKLKDCPTTRPKKPDPQRHRYLNAVLNAMRVIERQLGKNVDNVICDPDTRSQFDAMIQFLHPGASPFETQYAALSLRKSRRLRPEPVGQIVRAVTSKIIGLVDLEQRMNEVPERPGVYIFFDEEITLYVGKAEKLRDRIGEHISTWSYRDVIHQIREGRRTNTFVAYHELPVTITPRELAAYETELIRSRKPEHNRAGRGLPP